jgi:indolepyruvate ferredoxin oxidoreductase beta subunit
MKNNFKEKCNIIFAGVGGQGILFASEVMSQVAMKKGYDVTKSEVHGMSQRGGSVFSFVKYAKKVFSPLVEKGTGDILCAFEESEALRWVQYLKKDNPIIVVNKLQLIPPFVSLGITKYPENVEERLRKITPYMYLIPASEEAVKLGDIRVSNSFMLGVISNFLPFEEKIYIETIKEIVPRFFEINELAFKKGREFIKTKV